MKKIQMSVEKKLSNKWRKSKKWYYDLQSKKSKEINRRSSEISAEENPANKSYNVKMMKIINEIERRKWNEMAEAEMKAEKISKKAQKLKYQ
jgi:hypothetical protein